MQSRPRPLLCELHAHSTWSDGALTVRELVDLYGAAGFDVLAVTDHVCRGGEEHVTAETYDAYLAAVDRETERARLRYGLAVLPGLELTYDDGDPRAAAHAVALGLRSFVDVGRGIENALREARAKGAALVAAHPYTLDQAEESARGTARFAVERDWADEHVDAFELVNRHQVFGWISKARLPAIASGDFHRPEHLESWKTLVPCAHDAEAVVEHLRDRRAVHLTRYAGATGARARGRGDRGPMAQPVFRQSLLASPSLPELRAPPLSPSPVSPRPSPPPSSAGPTSSPRSRRRSAAPAWTRVSATPARVTGSVP